MKHLANMNKPSQGDWEFLLLKGLSGLEEISADEWDSDLLFFTLFLGVPGDLPSKAACNIFPALFSGTSGELSFSKLL